LEAQIAAFRSLETRVAALEGEWREAEARGRVGRPWEAEGISRSAWYRRRKSVGSPSARGACFALAGIPDGDAYTLPASEVRRRGLKIKFVRRMSDHHPRAIDLATSRRVNVRALVTHRESLKAARALFEALAQNRPGCVKALPYPNGEDGDGPNLVRAPTWM
jgi:L-iditol 2-dehydrogenase